MAGQFQKYAEEERAREEKMVALCGGLTQEEVGAIADWIGATMWRQMGRTWAMFAVVDLQRNFKGIMEKRNGGHLPVQ